MTPPLCTCHQLVMGWQKDPRLKGGGRWECRERRRLYNQTRTAERVAWVTAKRDRDPVYRINCELATRRRKALKSKAKRHSLRGGDQAGQVQTEGRDGSQVEPDP